MPRKIFIAMACIGYIAVIAFMVLVPVGLLPKLVLLAVTAALLYALYWIYSPSWPKKQPTRHSQRALDQATLTRLQDHLEKGGLRKEHILVATRQHWIVLVQAGTLFVIAVLMLITSLWLSTFSYTVAATLDEPARQQHISRWWVFTLLAIVPLLYGAWRWLVWACTYWLITNTLLVRVRLQPRGFPLLGSFSNPLPASKIYDVKEEAPFPGNIFGWVKVRASTQLQREEDSMYNNMPFMPESSNFTSQLRGIVSGYN